MVVRVLVALALLCSVVHAEDKPWANGVPQAEQDAALKDYGIANDLFEKGNFLEALEVYKRALGHWKHPAIHYNTAICFINLDRTLEAFDHMEKAMAFGEAPLGKDLFREGKNYLKVLGKQVATLKVELETHDATVRLDGTVLIERGSKTATKRVLANEPHTLIGEKPGFKTKTVPIKLEGGKTTELVLQMELEEKGRTERRWARWKPWAVVAAGGVVALVGVPLLSTAKGGFEDYDNAFATGMCSMGCLATDVPGPVAKLKTEAESRQNMAYGAFAVGGATIVAGLVLVVLNQPRLVGASVKPAIGKEQVGATVSFSW